MSHLRPFPAAPSARPVPGPAAPDEGPVAPDAGRATLSEIWSAPGDAAAAAFALPSLARAGPVLWVQDRLSTREMGAPYAPALCRALIHVRCTRAGDALAAMEAGLGCPALAAVIGEIWGAPPQMSFVATQRLALRAEAAGMPCWLVRRGAGPGPSAARMRWRVASLPSAPDPFDDRAPGAARWRAELFRARGVRPGTWIATHERAADRLHLAAPPADRAVDAPAGGRPRSAAG